jgi:hypothetical protein
MWPDARQARRQQPEVRMAMLPARRSGQQLTILDPSREFEDIYNRMGQLKPRKIEVAG